MITKISMQNFFILSLNFAFVFLLFYNICLCQDKNSGKIMVSSDNLTENRIELPPGISLQPEKRNKLFAAYGIHLAGKKSVYGAGYIHDLPGKWSIKTGAYVYTNKKYAVNLLGYWHSHFEKNNWDIYAGAGIQYYKTEDQKLFLPEISVRGDFNISRDFFIGPELDFIVETVFPPFLILNFGYKF